MLLPLDVTVKAVVKSSKQAYHSSQEFLCDMEAGLLDGQFHQELRKLTPEQLKEVAATMAQRATNIMDGWGKEHARKVAR